jgi:hypothetical protein
VAASSRPVSVVAASRRVVRDFNVPPTGKRAEVPGPKRVAQ